MNQELIQSLSVITEEEQKILAGSADIDRTLYMDREDMVIDSDKLLEAGQLITIRPHTRFVHFPEHTHNYVEVIYMCRGETIHVVDGRELKLKEGELLFLNQHAVQEIRPAGQDDIAVNFIILPEFFDTAFRMMGEEENLLRDFIVGCLCDDTRYGRYLHFQIADVLPVQNLVENLVWSLMHEREGMQAMNQTTMGLLLRHLMHYTGRIRVNRDSEQSFEQQLTLQVLRYIDEHYREGSLTELAALMGYDVYWLSRAINRLLGRNYKELLQIKRLNQAAFLLHSTRMPVADVSFAVGYDNTSYFYRIFRTYYGMSPREYRKTG